VAWYSLGDALELDLLFARVSAAGEPVGAARDLRQPSLATGVFGLAADGEGWAIAWNAYDFQADGSGERLVRVRTDGAPGAVVQVSRSRYVNGGSNVVRADRVLALAWEQDVLEEPNELAFASVGERGVVQPPRVIFPRTSVATDPALAWNGDGFGLAWTDQRSGALGVYFGRLGADGALTGAALRLGQARVEALLPSLAWTGAEYGVAWTEVVGQTARLRFARVTRDGRLADAAREVARW
jgi:hypothetical protein